MTGAPLLEVGRALPCDDLVHGWWVREGRLAGVEYPGARTPEKARRRVAALLGLGLRSFVDLTEPGESTFGGPGLVDYAPELAEVAAGLGLDVDDRADDPGPPLPPGPPGVDVVVRRRAPVRDLNVAEDGLYRAVHDHVDAELAAGRPAVVHCWGGVGRTSSVLGTYLVHHGVPSDEVQARLDALRAPARKARRQPRRPTPSGLSSARGARDLTRERPTQARSAASAPDHAAAPGDLTRRRPTQARSAASASDHAAAPGDLTRVRRAGAARGCEKGWAAVRRAAQAGRGVASSRRRPMTSATRTRSTSCASSVARCRRPTTAIRQSTKPRGVTPARRQRR